MSGWCMTAERADAAHAALFRRPWVTVLNARRTGEGTERVLAAAGILDKLIEDAMAGTLTPAGHAGCGGRGAAIRVTSRPFWPRPRRAAGGAGKAHLPQRDAPLKAPRFARRLAELTGAEPMPEEKAASGAAQAARNRRGNRRAREDGAGSGRLAAHRAGAAVRHIGPGRLAAHRAGPPCGASGRGRLSAHRAVSRTTQ